MVRAVWNGKVIAESDRTEVVEGNHYFAPEHVRREFLAPSDHHTTCAWKGAASYYHIVVDGAQNRDAAWYYPDPKPAAKNISGKIAFWKGVRIETSQLEQPSDRWLARQIAGCKSIAERLRR